MTYPNDPIAYAGYDTGSASPTSLTITIPNTTGVQSGCNAVIFASWTSTGQAASLPAGWTAGTAQTNGTLLQSNFWKKALGSTDAGANITLSLSGAGARISAAVVVYDQYTDFSQAPVTAQVTSFGASQTIPAITAGADSKILAYLGLNSNTNPTGVTPPLGWTELVDDWTSNSTGNTCGSWLAQQIATQASGTTSSATTASQTSARSNAIVIAVHGVTPPPTVTYTAGTIYQYNASTGKWQ